MRSTALASWTRFTLLALLLGATVLGADADPPPVPAALPGAEPFSQSERASLIAALGARSGDRAVRTRHLDDAGRPRFTNRLILERSPYLQQHAHNPVDWRPWGDEAFAAAKRLGRPVFLSIGYSTCHWCHVMEAESFDDPELAAVLNAHFIAIKVDRETRPDIDAIYMTAVNAMGERGGWPLNVFLTPDRQPFFGGTYFPPRDVGGRPSFRRVLDRMDELWRTERPAIERSAARVAAAIRAELAAVAAPATRPVDDALLDRAAAQALESMDPEYGGRAGQVKFPSSVPLR